MPPLSLLCETKKNTDPKLPDTQSRIVGKRTLFITGTMDSINKKVRIHKKKTTTTIVSRCVFYRGTPSILQKGDHKRQGSELNNQSELRTIDGQNHS